MAGRRRSTAGWGYDVQQLANLLMLVSLLVSVPCFVYGFRHPHRQGEPYGFKEHKPLWIWLLLSAGFLVAGLIASVAGL
jgi:hypothetical protein